MIVIEESGLRFGPYPQADCFELEKSPAYKRIQSGVMMCEFALIRRPDNRPLSIWLVEAKQSSPRPETQPSFSEFIEEIRQKLSNALQLVVALHLERHEDPLPEGFRALTLREGLKLVLVINGHQESWLPPLQEALRVALNPLVRTFGLDPNAVAVINDDSARRRGLLVPAANLGAS